MLGTLPPSHTLASSQKSTVVSVTQDRAEATASVDFSPTINIIQTQIAKETDPVKLSTLTQQLQQLIGLQRDQFEYQKAQDAEAKTKAEAEEKARREAERKAR